MQVQDTEGRYISGSKISELVGDVVGSKGLGERIINSLLLPDETPTERNLQIRLREALNNGVLQAHGLGPKRLKRLQSALVLGKILYLDTPDAGLLVEDPLVAARAFDEIAWEPVEKFAVLALDVKHRVMSMRILSSGTATETTAHPRDIFRWLMMTGSTRCIVAHNHPSGSVEPSAEDIVLTQTLLKASKMIGIPIMDHLVIAGKKHYSIRQNSDLWAELT